MINIFSIISLFSNVYMAEVEESKSNLPGTNDNLSIEHKVSSGALVLMHDGNCESSQICKSIVEAANLIAKNQWYLIDYSTNEAAREYLRNIDLRLLEKGKFSEIVFYKRLIIMDPRKDEDFIKDFNLAPERLQVTNQ